MELSTLEKKEFIEILRELLETDQIYKMRNYLQHGNTSTFSHCLVVAYYSYLISRRLPIPYDARSIIRGAMLHDFFLYDWHIPEKWHKLHGFVHADFALNNARNYFQLNPIEEDIIAKHMWPLTLRKVPIYKEAILVNMVDKLCSLSETLYIPITTKELKRLHRALDKKCID